MSTTPSQRPRQPDARRTGRKGGSTRKITGIKRTAQQPDAAPATAQERLRHYLPYALVPNLAMVLGVIAVCFAVILVGGWSLAYLPGAVGEAWLALHGVPLRVDGVTLSAMPLLPVVGVVAVVATQVRKATAGRVSVLDLLGLLGLVLGVPFLLSAVALFMVFDASRVYALEMPSAALALVCPVIVHLVGFVLGVRRVVWSALAKRCGVPVGAVEAATSAARLCVHLFAAASAVYVVALALGHNRVSELLTQYPQLGVGGAAALLLLSVLYLPNAVMAQLALMLGGSFKYGGADVSVFAASNVPYPPLPLFAAIPATMPQWAPVVLVVPVAVLARAFVAKPLRLEDVAAAATWAALFGALAGVFASGDAGAYLSLIHI